jgi:hypothetical protein
VTHQVQQTSIADSTVSQVPAAEPHGAPEMDLLGFGAEPTPAPVIAPHSFRLIPNVALTGDEYQTKWSAVQDADSHVIIVPLSTQPGSTDDVERLLEEAFIKTMASGELPTEFKFFLYAQEVPPTGSILLVQASIAKNVSPCEMLLTIKVSGPGGLEKVEAFVNILKNALSPYV